MNAARIGPEAGGCQQLVKTKISFFRARLCCAVVLGMGSLVSLAATFSDANWMSMGGVQGANGQVQAVAVDGSGNLYVGGRFNVIGDVVAKFIAKWDGTRWSALGSGINDEFAPVSALAVSGTNLYAGGNFTMAGGVTVNRIARWDGSRWSALSSGMNDSVSALAVSGGNLYALGYFTTAGGTPANHIAKWNGSSWSALGSGLDGNGGFPYLFALAVSGSNVYAGGIFTTAGGTSVNNIAKWNGSSWSALGSGIPFGGNVSALAVSGSNVYVGGQFQSAGGIAATNLARWNGSSWSAMGSMGNATGDGSAVWALSVSGSDLYAGGYFTNAGATAANHVAKWNGSSWSPLGLGTDWDLSALAVSGSNVYAGGRFYTAGGSEANFLAKWDGTTWSVPGPSVGMTVAPRDVFAMAVLGSDLYAGGGGGGSTANRIAKWNGSGWTTLGSGISAPADYYGGYVYALVVSGGDVYAGGVFTTAGGSAATNIAKWNGSNWSALGAGISSPGYSVLYALTVSGNDLYAGGAFTTAGGGGATNIAKWNGSSWLALGSGISAPDNDPYYGGTVGALAVSGNDLYAAGLFTSAGGLAVTNIAKWDGNSWSALGSGINGAVLALAASGSDLYAGGDFTMAGGNAVNRIAKWNGNGWTTLGSGVNDTVYALVVSGSNVYAAGQFTMAGGSTANHIAKWDGSSWSALGSGMTGERPEVLALAVSGSYLYAGGWFTIAGGKVSAYVARAYLPTLPTLSVLRAGDNVKVSWPSLDTSGFILEQAGGVAAPTSWITNPTSVTDDGTNKSVTLPAMNSLQVFRLRRP
jgi:hypothetical protein